MKCVERERNHNLEHRERRWTARQERKVLDGRRREVRARRRARRYCDEVQRQVPRQRSEEWTTEPPEEIVRRFKKVFGREMTPDERDSLFLPDQEPTPPSAKR